MAMLSLLMSVNHIFFSGQQKMQLPSTGTLIIKSLPLYYTNSITPHMHYFSFCKIFPFNIIFTLVSYVVWIYETLAAWSGVNVCCGNWSRVVQGKLARGTQGEFKMTKSQRMMRAGDARTGSQTDNMGIRISSGIQFWSRLFPITVW